MSKSVTEKSLKSYSIKNIEDIVKFDGKVKNVKISRLTAPGENFISLVLRVDFEVEKNGHSKIISSIAKLIPPIINDDKRFHLHGMAMKHEINFYSNILPILKDFAKENLINIDFFPEYIGSRYSLDSSSKGIDGDAVLLLENLIPEGYQNEDRYIGCDLPTTQAVLKSLALFHGLPIAIKIKKPELFNTIQNFVQQQQKELFNKDNSHTQDKNPDDNFMGLSKQTLFDVLGNIPELAPYMTKIKPKIDNLMTPETFSRLTKEPWNTITHNDLWINNVMINYKKEKKPLIKLVDFQAIGYGSFAKDLVFFMFTSVRNDIIREHMDDLLRFYYEEFTTVLRDANVNLELTYAEYLEELRSSASSSKFGDLLWFTAVVFGENKEGVNDEHNLANQLDRLIKTVSDKRKEKLILISSEAVQRNWI